MPNFRLRFADAKALNYADPAKLSHTLRVINETGTKSVKGVSALNNRLELISANTAPVTEGDKTADEIIAGRVQLSGSTANQAAVLAMWNELKANTDAAIADGALTGFPPTNAVYVIVPVV
jgi:hypothetical protein